MNFFYNLLAYGTLPFAVGRIIYKSFKLPSYRERIYERFGVVKFPQLKRSIWLHAVSVGEVQAALPICFKLREKFPEIPIVITTTTPTGSNIVQKNLRPNMYHSYLPYDVNKFVTKFIDHVNPVCFIVMETEIWPNLFCNLYKNNVPIVIANGRISPSSYKNYLKIKFFMSKILNKCSYILVQNEEYAKRFIDIGAPEKKVRVFGNIKFDIPVPEDKIQSGKELKEKYFGKYKILIGASTHGEEEKTLLDIYSNLIKKNDKLKLILVPRHPERFNLVYDLCKSYGFNVHRRSYSLVPEGNFDVYLGDSMGEMMMYYAMSDVAFVGGSLEKIGGHNVLEPASIGVPVVIGPNYFNFQEIIDVFKKNNAIVVAKDKFELEKEILNLLENKDKRTNIRNNAKKVLDKNKGALSKTLDVVSSILDKRI